MMVTRLFPLPLIYLCGLRALYGRSAPQQLESDVAPEPLRQTNPSPGDRLERYSAGERAGVHDLEAHLLRQPAAYHLSLGIIAGDEHAGALAAEHRCAVAFRA